MKPQNLNLLHLGLLLALSSRILLADGIRPFGYDTPSYLDFELTSYSVSEDSSSISLTLIRQGDFRRYSSVDYSTADATASSGEDFKASGGTIVFAPGETRKVIQIDLLPDSNVEGTETFQVQLESPDPNSILITSEITVEIQDVAAVAEVPKLEITPLPGARIQLAWEQEASNYALERCLTACDDRWEPVPEAPEQVDGRNVIVQSIAGPHYFYRLRAE